MCILLGLCNYLDKFINCLKKKTEKRKTESENGAKTQLHIHGIPCKGMSQKKATLNLF